MAGARLVFLAAAKATIEETRRDLVATAKREHGKIMRADPKPDRFDRFVDGRRGATEEAVKDGGTIRYVYPRLNEVVQFALETLFDLSPVLSGEYRNGHTLFVNGVAVRNLTGVDDTADIAITNYLPYARKIELGVMSMRVPGSAKVYFQAGDIVRRRFGNSARIDFAYRAVAGGSMVPGKKGNESGLRYPSLLISGR